MCACVANRGLQDDEWKGDTKAKGASIWNEPDTSQSVQRADKVGLENLFKHLDDKSAFYGEPVESHGQADKVRSAASAAGLQVYIFSHSLRKGLMSKAGGVRGNFTSILNQLIF